MRIVSKALLFVALALHIFLAACDGVSSPIFPSLCRLSVLSAYEASAALRPPTYADALAYEAKELREFEPEDVFAAISAALLEIEARIADAEDETLAVGVACGPISYPPLKERP